MKKIIEYINNKILKNKKLWLVCAAFMSLFMCLPTTAYAHGGEIVFVFIAWGIYAIVMSLITVISIKFPNFFILILNIIILFLSIVSFVLLPLTFLPVINIILILIMMTTPKYLIKYGKVEELKEKISKDTMLCYALLLDEIEIAKMLIGKNADINIKGNWGWTPLYIVVDSGNIELINLLILKDADVNVKNDLGSSPLHRAVLNNRKDIVEILLAKGADLNAKDNLEDTPLDKAETEDIKQLLISHGAKNAKDL